DHVQIAGICTPHFGRGAVQYELKFADGQLREEKCRFIRSAAARAALERIVEVHTVNRDVGVDRTLPIDHNSVTIAFLRRVRRKLDEFREVAATDRQVFNRSLTDRDAVADVLAVHNIGYSFDVD